MKTLLLIFLCIDLLITYYLFRQAFMVRSNMNRKYKRRFTMMLAVIGGSAFLYRTNLPLACLIAGIPACLVSLFIIALAIAFVTHKGPWR
ncbi:hypothetical protein [Haliscomenobacter hydrossis]|uniref:Uncharacterized protein n=1 Tax=Haliscomenobacter hydrossis (strain ATCC 27775 / DSM 1100 / LMG 10767 / O) TaxID=760192 RepID=F4L7K1_HALH1|nr:hypothetical protein [Haliscomenobacter hydrossis]AEE54181.1 hypothetical protein Halhy_6362 [Haliscomenobacter hydrossis DSM 1100]